jgi:exodeoxyribonuclease V gamma subunit
LISYVGRSAVHNKELPPSVVVNELLDYLSQAFVFPEAKSAKQFLLTEHPLHAFSPRYFSASGANDGFFSFSEANAEASRSISARRAPAMPPFITEALPQIEELNRNLELRELIDFWGNPSRYFVRRRLGLTLRKTGDCLNDNEPFQLDNLEKYLIKQELLEEELEAGQLLPPAVFQERGILPPGVIGELQLRSMRTEVQKLTQVVQGYIGGGKKDEPVSVDLNLEAFSLSGKINSLYGGRGVYFRTAKLNPKDYLRAWIEHLVLCAIDDDKDPHTVLIGKDAVVTFRRVPSARAELEILCGLFWQGLMLPLPFFPASAMAFVDAERTGFKDPLTKARAKWNGPWLLEGEKDNAFFARCFDVSDPLDAGFVEIARMVFKPMLEHEKREEL